MKRSRDLSELANLVLETSTSLPNDYYRLRSIVQQLTVTEFMSTGHLYGPAEINDTTRELLVHLENLNDCKHH